MRTGALIGTRGVLFEVKYQGGLSTSTDRPVSFKRTLGGKRKALLGPRGRREWDVSFDPVGVREVAGLVEIARTEGSVLWYPADAVNGNLLSPQAAGFEVVPAGATGGGLVALPDGDVARSVVHTGTSSIVVGDSAGAYEPVPVRAGVPVSVGGWGLGGVRFLGVWRNASLASLGSFSASTVAGTGWVWRDAVLTPPAGAVAMSLSLAGGSQYARPTIRWGTAIDSHPGRGCPKAVLSGLSEELNGFDQHGPYGAVSVTITEVG